MDDGKLNPLSEVSVGAKGHVIYSLLASSEFVKPLYFALFANYFQYGGCKNYSRGNSLQNTRWSSGGCRVLLQAPVVPAVYANFLFIFVRLNCFVRNEQRQTY